VIALSLVFFAARYASPVYQTLALLVFAYVVRFFPQALSGVESALQRVSPRVEEAARGLGRGPLGTLVTVTAPLARSGMLAGGALVFLSAMKELPATLLLRPIGFETLATEIWKLTQVGAYSRAAVPSLMLIAVSAPVLYLVSTDRRSRLE
jgi:iron(III) transport system permease protein